MSAILKFNFQKKKTITFSEVNYLNYTKKDPILHVTTTFSLRQGETRTNSVPIPHSLSYQELYTGIKNLRVPISERPSPGSHFYQQKEKQNIKKMPQPTAPSWKVRPSTRKTGFLFSWPKRVSNSKEIKRGRNNSGVHIN